MAEQQAEESLDQTPRRISPPHLKPEEGERLGDFAYRAILQGLFTKTIPVGAFLSQGDLVELLGVPLQPLRDALRLLEAEGVLTVHSRSGIQFLKPDLEFARSTFQFRLVLERPAARRYAETGPMEEIQALIADHLKLRGLIETDGLTGERMAMLEELEQRLHGGMIANMRNRLIASAARRIQNYVVLIRLERPLTPPLALLTLAEHLKILDACAARRPEAAEEALSDHLKAALQRMLGMF